VVNEDCVMYMLILESLQMLLNNKAVLAEVIMNFTSFVWAEYKYIQLTLMIIHQG